MELLNQIVLTFLLMFVVLYVFFNINNLRNGDIFSGNNLKKTLIIALIGTLLFYLYMTWEENDKVPSYSIANKKLDMNNSNRINFMNNFIQNEEPSIFLSSRQPYGVGY